MTWSSLSNDEWRSRWQLSVGLLHDHEFAWLRRWRLQVLDVHFLFVLDLVLGLLDDHVRVRVDVQAVLIEWQLSAPRQILLFVDPQSALVVAQRDLFLIGKLQRILRLEYGSFHSRLDLACLRITIDNLITVYVRKLVIRLMTIIVVVVDILVTLNVTVTLLALMTMAMMLVLTVVLVILMLVLVLALAMALAMLLKLALTVVVNIIVIIVVIVVIIVAEIVIIGNGVAVGQSRDRLCGRAACWSTIQIGARHRLIHINRSSRCGR